MQCYGSEWRFNYAEMTNWFQPQPQFPPTTTHQQPARQSCFCQYALFPPCRQSRFDNWYCENEPQPLTLFREQSVRRIQDKPFTGNCCLKRTNSTPRPSNDTAYLSPPIILKNCQRTPTPQNNLRNHLSRSSSCQSFSPCRKSGTRSVRFGSCTSIDDEGCERILYAHSSPQKCPTRLAQSPKSRSRESSVVRVISRSCSPCQTFITASLPSRAAVSCIDAGSQMKQMCSVGNDCNFGPVCKPKPKGNLKYHCGVENMCSPASSCETFPLPPPPTPPEPGCCCVIEEADKEERSMPCPCPDMSPPRIERYETTCRVERVTRSNVSRSSVRHFQSTERCKEEREIIGAGDGLITRYRHLVVRKEEELKDKIELCEMDLAACEYMMSKDGTCG